MIQIILVVCNPLPNISICVEANVGILICKRYLKETGGYKMEMAYSPSPPSCQLVPFQISSALEIMLV